MFVAGLEHRVKALAAVMKGLNCPASESELKALLAYYSHTKEKDQMNYKLLADDLTKGMR